MSEGTIRIKKAATECNISVSHVVEHLATAGYTVEANPNAKITEEMYQRLLKDFGQDIKVKEQAASLGMNRPTREDVVAPRQQFVAPPPSEPELNEVRVKGLSGNSPRVTRPTAERPELKVIRTISLDDKGKPRPDGGAGASTVTGGGAGTASSAGGAGSSAVAGVAGATAVAGGAGSSAVSGVAGTTAVAGSAGTASSAGGAGSSAVSGVAGTTAVAGGAGAPAMSPPRRPEEGVPSPPDPKAVIPGQGTTRTVEVPGPAGTTSVPGTGQTSVAAKPATGTAPLTEKPEATPVPQKGQSPVSETDPATPAKLATATATPVAPANGQPGADPTRDAVAATPTTGTQSAAAETEDVIRARADKLQGTRILGSIDLTQFEKKKPVASSVETSPTRRKRTRTEVMAPARPAAAPPPGPARPNTGPGGGQGDRRPGSRPGGGPPPRPAGGSRKRPALPPRPEHSEKDIQDQIKATMARLQGGGKGAKSRFKPRKKGEAGANEVLGEGEKIKLPVTEFITTGDLAQLMEVSVAEIIQNCFMLGLVVTINQRLDAETIALVADDFGYDVEFISADAGEPELIDEDQPERMSERPPIVTIMGHVDHGKTSLLDYIRKENVIAGEAGGITQHIGAYAVQLPDGRHITFLDTPGHEAFTAMRARGAKVTDLVVVVIAADDQVMPQTREAISHAQAAGVPIIFAFNKMDKPTADAEKIKEQLSQLNILVESWGGKYQDQEISAKKGTNIDLLLEKILLEAELLELKADPEKRALGTVIEASLDKGRGVVTTILVQGGTLSIGDPILAGANFGKVKAMLNERGQRIKVAGPSTPVQLLGFNSAPTAGDILIVPETEAIARDIGGKRQQLLREQGIRTRKHITLDEIGRRLAIGNFKELKLVVKGDVDGSVEALSDSLMKLSTEQIAVNVIHKGVGQITESDVMLASASDAIIVGFQVRPLASVRKLAEQEQIDVRTYSVIYDAIEEIKSAMEGMLAPTFEEKVLGTVEIREVFKITRVGNIAGCMVLEGKVTRNAKIRLLREGVIMHTGELASLRRFKEDVKEVNHGYECGLNLTGYQDIQVGDVIEAFERVEVKTRL